MKVLIVEDDFTSRTVLQRFLSKYGECHVAVNGKEAIQAVRSAAALNWKYDLICMDILMPELDGRSALKQIRALEAASGILSSRGSKIIMTTGISDVKEVLQTFHDLADAYLVKPLDMSELLNHLKQFHLV